MSTEQIHVAPFASSHRFFTSCSSSAHLHKSPGVSRLTGIVKSEFLVLRDRLRWDEVSEEMEIERQMCTVFCTRWERQWLTSTMHVTVSTTCSRASILKVWAMLSESHTNKRSFRRTEGAQHPRTKTTVARLLTLPSSLVSSRLFRCFPFAKVGPA